MGDLPAELGDRVPNVSISKSRSDDTVSALDFTELLSPSIISSFQRDKVGLDVGRNCKEFRLEGD